MPSKPITELEETKKRLRQEQAAGASGLSVVRALSDAVDSVLAQLFARPTDGNWALVATGGYGRRELSPSSDIDLIVMHSRGSSVSDQAKQLSYALWDAGLDLGLSVRTPRDALVHAKENFQASTAFLDARLVLGDSSFFEKWYTEFLTTVRKRGGWFVENLRNLTEERRFAAGDAGAELEPNIKDGRGGLRDLSSIRWIGLVTGEPGLLNDENSELTHAANVLHQTRNALHFLTERRTDILLMQLQEGVADFLGEETFSTAEDLVRHLYRGARKISHALDSALHEDPPNRGIRFQIEVAQNSGGVWSQAMRESFFDVLRQAPNSGRDFIHISLTGALPQAMEEWTEIDCLPQRNVYHRFAVDVHSFEAVASLVQLKDSEDDLIKRVATDMDPVYDRLLLAGLLHDIGKGSRNEEHSERGEKLAHTVCERMGLDPEETADVAWLVRNHLLLSETATRRDIGDESLIVEIAEKIGSERRLGMLFLLSVADALATGPTAWSPWKATLVSRLFTRINLLLERGELVGVGASATARKRSEELRAALSDYPEALVEAHLANMPRAWLLSMPVPDLVKQSTLMMDPPLGDEIVVHPEAQTSSGIWEVVVLARDRPGLFSKVAGALALHGLNVLGAQIFTREDGVALEVFRVEAIGNEEHRFERMARDAQLALRGRLSLDLRLSDKRREYAGRIGKGKREPPRVIVDNFATDFYTVIEVHTTDRVGLLYTITRALSDLELDIHIAKVSTYAEDVVDVFYVRDLDGQKISDPDHVREIERTILHRLALETGP